MLCFHVPDFHNPALKLTINGVEKSSMHIPNQRMPLLPSHLKTFYTSLDQTKESDVVLWVKALIVYFAMFRKAQFVASSGKRFDIHE